MINSWLPIWALLSIGSAYAANVVTHGTVFVPDWLFGFGLFWLLLILVIRRVVKRPKEGGLKINYEDLFRLRFKKDDGSKDV